MSDPWGVDERSSWVDSVEPLPPRLVRLAEVQATGVALLEEDPYGGGFPRGQELPEVQSLMRDGWRPLHPASLYCLLPAAWPPHHRTWVRDRLPRVGMGGTTDSYFGRVVALEDDGVVAEMQARSAFDVGLPAPPPGRIWMLRSPWPRISVSVIYQIIWSLVAGRPGHDEIQRVYRVACDVLGWDEEKALAACPDPTKELLDAWARAGRVGESAAVVIEHRLAPTDLARVTTMTGLEGATALAWLDSLQVDLDDEAITFINGWRSVGLPGSPPPAAYRFLHREPTELRTWLDAGFDLYAAFKLELCGLAAAIRWREAGFSAAETYELLRDDPALTPDEARTFETPELADHRRHWIYYGFTAAEATAWAATGLTPIEARLWRSCAKQPRDVPPGMLLPPDLTNERGHRRRCTTFQHGENVYPEWDHLVDPPGTRGRHARRRAGDQDLSINTD